MWPHRFNLMIVDDNAAATEAPGAWRGAPPEPPSQFPRDSAGAKLLALLRAEADRIDRNDRENLGEAARSSFVGSAPLALEPERCAALRSCKLRTMPVETAIVERYRRRESSLEEVLLTLYHAGTSLHGIERICEALWGVRIDPAIVCELSRRATAQIAASIGRTGLGAFPYVFLAGLAIRRGSGREIDELPVVVTVGVDREGFRSLLGVQVAAQAGADLWHACSGISRRAASRACGCSLETRAPACAPPPRPCSRTPPSSSA